jgi:hypothetical protein
LPSLSPAAAFVERELGVDQLAAVGRQPFDPVERAVALLAAGERHLDRALRGVALLLEPDQRIHPHGGHRLHVGHTARVEIAVLLEQGEGVALPVLAFRFDHIDVRDQENRLRGRRGTGIDHHQPAFLRMLGGGEQRQLTVGEARGFEPRPHAFSGERAAAGRQRRVGFDQLFEELTERHLVGTDWSRHLRRRRARECEQEEQCEGFHDHDANRNRGRPRPRRH